MSSSHCARGLTGAITSWVQNGLLEATDRYKSRWFLIEEKLLPYLQGKLYRRINWGEEIAKCLTAIPSCGQESDWPSFQGLGDLQNNHDPTLRQVWQKPPVALLFLRRLSSPRLREWGRPKERFNPIKFMSQRVSCGTLQEHWWRVPYRNIGNGLLIGVSWVLATVASKSLTLIV